MSRPTSRCRHTPACESSPAPKAIQTSTIPTIVSSARDRRSASATEHCGGVRSVRRSIAALYREAAGGTTIRAGWTVTSRSMPWRCATRSPDPSPASTRRTTPGAARPASATPSSRSTSSRAPTRPCTCTSGRRPPRRGRSTRASRGCSPARTASSCSAGSATATGRSWSSTRSSRARRWTPSRCSRRCGRSGWAAASWAARLHALLSDAVPVPPAPQTPAARLRDAADHVEMTTRRVRRYLDERHGGFQHDPDWGFHGAFGSARVFVDVLPVLDDSTAVRASAPVLSDIDLSDGLAVKVAEVDGRDAVRRLRPPGRPPRAVVPARDPRRRPRHRRARGGDRDGRRGRRRVGRPPRAGVRRPALRRPGLSGPFPHLGELRPRQFAVKRV